MELNGRQRQQFQQALLSAFPSKAKLAQMLSFELDWELDAIAGGQNQSEIIFNLIKHAKANGQLNQLLNAATSTNPGNPALQDFAKQFGNPTHPSSTPEASPTEQSSSFNQTNAGGTNFQTQVTGGQVNQAQTINIYQNAPQSSAPQNSRPAASSNSATSNPISNSPTTSDPAPASANHSPIKVFVSYSHKDENFREELDDHLSLLKRQGQIDAWNDRAIEAGSEWQKAIEKNLKDAQIILLLISAKFIASDFCYCKELTHAMARHDAGTARVIPIVLKPCDWKNAPFSKLKILPRDGKAINTWNNQDEAFVDVVQGIREAIASLKQA